MPYRIGEQTLVFAGRDQSGTLINGMCTSSTFAKGHEAELDYVRRYFSGQTTTSILGRAITWRGRALLEGIRIVARNAGQEFTAYSGKDGRFEILNVPEGTFQIRAAAEGYFEPEPQRPFTVNRRGCKEVELELSTKNKIEGMVVNPDHQPVANLDVFLHDPKRPQEYGSQVRTDNRGRFRFERINVAEYQLMISPDRAVPDSPIDKTIYPKPIVVSPTSEIAGLNFIVPHRQPTRNIRIRLTWPDGSPVQHANIACPEVDSRNPGPSWRIPGGYTGKTGVATCLTMTDRQYKVSLKVMGWGPRQFLIHPLDTPVPHGRNDVELDLQLSAPDYEVFKLRPNAP